MVVELYEPILESKSLTLQEKGQALVIQNQATYEQAIEFVKTVKAMQNEVKDAFDPLIEKAHQTHKEAISKRDKYLKPLLALEQLINLRRTTWITEQERVQKEEQLRLEREAEKKRQDALAKANAARASGNEAKAEKYESKASEIITPIAPPKVVPVTGASYRDDWYAVVVDEKLVPREYLIVDEQKLNKIAKAVKGTLQIPGVQFQSRKIPVTRI